MKGKQNDYTQNNARMKATLLTVSSYNCIDLCYLQYLQSYLHCSSSHSDLPQKNAEEEESTYPLVHFWQLDAREYLHAKYIDMYSDQSR